MLLNSVKSGSRSVEGTALRSFALEITQLKRCHALGGHKEFFSVFLAVPLRNVLVKAVGWISEPTLVTVFQRTRHVCSCQTILALSTEPNRCCQKLLYLVIGCVLVSQITGQRLRRGIGICDTRA